MTIIKRNGVKRVITKNAINKNCDKGRNAIMKEI